MLSAPKEDELFSEYNFDTPEKHKSNRLTRISYMTVAKSPRICPPLPLLDDSLNGKLLKTRHIRSPSNKFSFPLKSRNQRGDLMMTKSVSGVKQANVSKLDIHRTTKDVQDLNKEISQKNQQIAELQKLFAAEETLSAELQQQLLSVTTCKLFN